MTRQAPDPKRRAMTPTRKLRIWSGQNGLCGCGCGEAVPLSGPNVRYDHTITFWMRPDLDDDGPNVKAVLTEHDKPKTYGQDIPRIAKAKRQMALRLDMPPKPSKGRAIRSQGFGDKHKPLTSRNTFRQYIPK